VKRVAAVAATMAVAGALFSPAGAAARPQRAVCGPPARGFVHCHAHVITDERGDPFATSGPAGLGPADLRSAYELSTATTAGAGQTIAIVDAYDDPKAEADLATYRSHYGLPPCTVANGCFRKVNQTGGSRLPRADRGWAQEISLDLDMASATCPNCKILLVEASSNSLANLGTAVNTAAALGATQISNSYGAGEFSSQTAIGASYYKHPGVAITASSGDAGYGVEFPAASQYVTAVGGTTLSRAANARGWTETAWSGAGSGCSAYEPKPSWQMDTGCSRRTVADVSAVADPNTGVSVYDTYKTGGWLVFGGTSASAPIIAGVYALQGTASPWGSADPYASASSLFDIVGGSNGSCGGAYLCSALAGFDGPTGLGTPKGSAAF
jgi:subtilase family serine protease